MQWAGQCYVLSSKCVAAVLRTLGASCGLDASKCGFCDEWKIRTNWWYICSKRESADCGFARIWVVGENLGCGGDGTCCRMESRMRISDEKHVDTRVRTFECDRIESSREVCGSCGHSST